MGEVLYAGLHFLEVGVMADVLLIPATVAVLFPKKWFSWYLKVVPVLSLMVCVAAIHWYRILPMFCGKAAELSALIALLSYRLPDPLAEIGAGSSPGAQTRPLLKAGASEALRFLQMVPRTLLEQLPDWAS